MIDPRKTSEIGRPLGLVESDISEIGRAAVVARVFRVIQLVLPVLAGAAGILLGKRAFPTPSSSGYPLSITFAAMPVMAIVRKGSWKGVSILSLIGFLLGLAAAWIYSATRPDPPVILYGVYSR